MNGSVKNETNFVRDDDLWKEWKGIMLSMEIVTIILITATIYLLLSLLFYGTRTGRWIAKPGTSTLNNGAVYTVCVIGTLVTLPSMGFKEAMFVAARLNYVGFECGVFAAAASCCFFTASLMMYLFFWILQRRIYSHPSVRDRVNKCVNMSSRVFIIAIAIQRISVMLIYMRSMLTHPTMDATNLCFLMEPKSDKRIKAITTTTLISMIAAFTVQITMLALSVYPAVRARFPLSENPDDSEEKKMDSTHSHTRLYYCWETISLGKNNRHHISPIEQAVRRTAISSMLMVSTDVFAAIIDLYLIKPNVPIALHILIYDMSNFVNVIAMISTFGFASQVFTLFIPSCN